MAGRFFKLDIKRDYPDVHPLWTGNAWSCSPGARGVSEEQLHSSFTRALREAEQAAERVRVLRDLVRRSSAGEFEARCASCGLPKSACDDEKDAIQDHNEQGSCEFGPDCDGVKCGAA